MLLFQPPFGAFMACVTTITPRPSEMDFGHTGPQENTD
jgi:hypothetical protein